MPLGFLVGVALFFLGIAGVFVSLARVGALAKSKQFGALAGIFRGQHGARARAMLLGALVVMLAGMCLLFAMVGRQDAAMRSACDVACREWGLRDAHIAPSRTSERPQRACFCGTGAEAHQLYEIGGNGQPSGTSVPPSR